MWFCADFFGMLLNENKYKVRRFVCFTFYNIILDFTGFVKCSRSPALFTENIAKVSQNFRKKSVIFDVLDEKNVKTP